MVVKQGKTKKRKPMRGDRTMQYVSAFVLIFVLLLVGYPVIYVISASVSSAEALSAGRVLLWPVDMTMAGYKFVLNYRDVWVGYRNSILYTTAGVCATMGVTILAAYPLSRPDFPGRKLFTKFILVGTMFNAGLIPRFMIMAGLGLVGSPIAVIISGLVGVQSTIILKNAFQAIPQDLYDAAKIDGAHDFLILKNVCLPLAKATLSVLTLFCLVANWNEYFNSMIYLRDVELWPLQLVLRQILVGTEGMNTDSMSSAAQAALLQTSAEQIKYVLIIVATVPALLAYFLTQKNFKTGYMIGSVKG